MKSLEFHDWEGNRYFVGKEAIASALVAKPHQIVSMRKVGSVVEVGLDEEIGEGVTTWIVHPLTGERSGPHSDDASKAEARDNLRYNARMDTNGGDAGESR
jgi:hypothetical protein